MIVAYHDLVSQQYLCMFCQKQPLYLISDLMIWLLEDGDLSRTKVHCIKKVQYDKQINLCWTFLLEGAAGINKYIVLPPSQWIEKSKYLESQQSPFCWLEQMYLTRLYDASFTTISTINEYDLFWICLGHWYSGPKKRKVSCSHQRRVFETLRA